MSNIIQHSRYYYEGPETQKQEPQSTHSAFRLPGSLYKANFFVMLITVDLVYSTRLIMQTGK
jgi:hypothetical protein